MANPMSDYVANFRANLPSGVTYNSDTADYLINGRRFDQEWVVQQYADYLSKFTDTIPESFVTSLFSSGEQGLWLDFSDQTSMSDSSDGTTPFSGSGSRIRSIADKSGNGYRFNNLSSSKSPSFTEVAGVSSAAFDGGEDTLKSTTTIDFSGSGVVTAVYAIKLDVLTSGPRFLLDHNDTGFRSFRVLTPNGGVTNAITTGSTGTSATVGAQSPTITDLTNPLIGTSVFDVASPSQEMQVNNGVVVTNTSSVGPTTFLNAFMTVGGETSQDRRFYDGSVSQMLLINRRLTSSELTSLKSFFAAKVNIDLT